jgi:hypothetical protein
MSNLTRAMMMGAAGALETRFTLMMFLVRICIEATVGLKKLIMGLI